MLQRHPLLAGQARPSLVPCSHVAPRQTRSHAAGRPQATSMPEQHNPDSNQPPLSVPQQHPGSSTGSNADPTKPVQAAASAALPTSSNGSSGQPGPGVTPGFHPRALTIHLQRAASIQALQAIWQSFQHQFNSYHFSALMQQLTKLHDQVNAGLAQGPAQQRSQQQHTQQAQQQQQQPQQQQQQRMDSLAELEQELGHLLESSNGSQLHAADSSNSSSSSKKNSSTRRIRSASSRGLADLCPALDGYEHLGSTPAAAASQRQQQPQRQRLAWRAQPPPQQQQQQQQQLGAAGANAAAGQASAGGSMARPVRPPVQGDRPQWRPPAQGVLGSSSSSSSSSSGGRGTKRQQQQQGAVSPRSQPQSVQQAEMLRQIHQLALKAAAVAVQPDRAKTLDHRALVMVARNLAKMQLYDSSIMQQLLRALGAQALPQLDPQQLTNLIWSVGSCVGSTEGDSRSPYKTLAVPAVLRRFGAVVAVAAVAAEVDSGVDSSQGEGEDGKRWEQVAAVAELATADADAVGHLDDNISAAAAAAADLFADAVSVSVPSVLSSSRGDQPPAEWLAAAADALLQQLPKCGSQGVAMALWGFAELGFSPPAEWWEQFWGLTQGALPQYSAQDLALLMCAVGKLGPEVPASWLTVYCSAACDVMPNMSSQQLTMCLWGLGVSGASPHKAFVLLWFLTSMGLMQQATTQELSMWLYALTLLRITPSPSWCAAFVEASFTRFTAPNTRPQDLVTAMWSISRLGWSPPLLYWRGLMEAARERFDQFGPQDLANCISAASVVDVSCVSDAWLSGFIKASQTRLSAFEPVQLAHTANALALLIKSHQSAFQIVTAAWQSAFVSAAGQHLAAGRFSLRNLVLVVTSLRLLQFKPNTDVQQFLAEAEFALASMWPKERRRQQQEDEQHDVDSPEAC